MRRFIALIVMFVVPLQFAWSAVLNVGDHVESGVVVTQHAHDHDHHGGGYPDRGLIDTEPAEDGTHCRDCHHHASHCHHVFSFIFQQSTSPVSLELKAGAIAHIATAFVSRTPPPLDRPPLARA
jgi:hypothetical protein